MKIEVKGVTGKLKTAALVGVVTLLSPVILVSVGAATLIDRAKEPARRKEYAASQYFLDLGFPYERGAVYRQDYALYNEAKARGIDFKLVRNDDFSYIVCGGEVFLFPWFDAISYSDVERRWLVDISGDPYPLSDDFSYEIKKLTEEYRKMPVRVLVRESDLMPRNDLYGNGDSEDRARVLLPEYICLCSDFVSALEERSGANGK